MADEGFDDDGPEFRPPLPPEDRVWRHPAEIGAFAHAVATDEARTRRSPWAVGFVSVIGGVLLAGSLMFGAGGVGDEPGRIALRPVATLSPHDNGTETLIASLDVPKASDSVVGVDVLAGDEARSGNGFAARAPGVVVTTASLVAGADDIRVTDAEGRVHAATVLGADVLEDVAVLDVAGLVAPTLSLEGQLAPSPGDDVDVLFAARGTSGSSVPATVASTDARLSAGGADLHDVIRLDRRVDASAAGAPLVDRHGRVLGIVTALAADQDAIAVPTRTVRWVADQVVAVGEVHHGWMGIEGVTANGDEHDGATGALVSRVLDASPAQAAGLLADDVVVAFDGEPVDTMGSLIVAVRERAPGTMVTVRVLRDGSPTDVGVTLANAPLPAAAEALAAATTD
jgi:S1-C subfamily serine protease